MNDKLKITKDLKFDFYDLMAVVDTDHAFTLRDVLRACMNSKIPLDALCPIVRCGYIEQYWEEAESKEFDDDGQIEFLELYWEGSVDKEETGEISNYSSWSFHGMGKAGVVPDNFCNTEEETQKLRDEGYRQAYAVPMTPMYEMADYPINFRQEMIIVNWDGDDWTEPVKVDFEPSITLINLLYSIFWELCWYGSPEKRNAEAKELDDRLDEFDEACKDGTIDEITTPWEEVKERLEEKFKNKED